MNAAPFPSQGVSASQPSLMPRAWGAILALMCVGGLAAYNVSQETPTGRVDGRVLLKENNKPLGKVKLTLSPASDEDRDDNLGVGEGKGVRRIRAVTDANGNFEVGAVPVGFYHISAATHAHSISETTIFVNEDETTSIPLAMQRSEPELQVTQQQQEFLPSEKVVLPVQGYVDGAKPEGDTMRVRIFRTSLGNVLPDTKAASALNEVSNRYSSVAMLPKALMHPAQATAPRLVSTRTLPVKGADIEGFFHQRLDLGNLAAGLYLVDVTHGKNSICAQMKVSDSALIVKKSNNQLLAYTVDSQSGAPRPNAKIRVFKGGKIIATSTTDTQGLARIALKQTEDQANSGDRLLTLASIGGNEATVGQYDYSSEGEEGEEGHGTFTVHSYTDRPIYRPGGRVSFKGIIRRTLDTGSRYGVPTDEPVAVEVRDQSGERVAQMSLTTNRYGSIHDSFELSPEAPTGNYSLVTTIRGEKHTDDFTVASYRKPEFSATVTSNETHYAFGDDVEMMVKASYYFGAPVAGAKANYTIYRAPDWASMYGSEYGTEKDDAVAGEEETSESDSDYSGEYVGDGEVTLDENGSAIIKFPAQLELESKEGDASEETSAYESDKPQDQIYTVEVSVTDPSDRSTEATGTVPVSAGDFQLSAQTSDYFIAPQSTTKVTVKARDFDEKPVANTPITVDCSYREWNETGNGWKETPAGKYQATTDASGNATLTVKAGKEGVFYLNARTHDDKGRDIVATQSVWVSGDGGGDYDAQYSDLSVVADKKKYNAGETARVLLNSEHTGGTALLTIEGSKLFKAWLVNLDHRSTAIRVPLGADYGPNITLAACLVRDKTFARSEVPLKVAVPQRNIRVAIQSDRNKYKPGEKITYHVQTTNYQGQPVPCELSFGVVDESIYALQEDSPGALRAAFYPRNPNSVQTSYSFEPLYLGDANKSEPNIEARTKFMDTAFWKPDLQTDASGKASVSFDLPDNLTTWRATAVAETLDTAFGRRTQKVVVAKDFFVRLETPRFFTGGDDTQITALVHNDTAQEQEATIKMDATGLALGGDETRTLHIGAREVAKVSWPVDTDANGLSYTNLAHLKLTAWTPHSSSGVQLTDGVESNVPVRPHGRESIKSFVGHIVGSGTSTQQIAIAPNAIPAASQVTVRITPSVSDALVGALDYLTGFPYGCTEQTMSRFLPDILVQRTMRLQGLQDAQSLALKKRLPRMVRDGVTRLARFQHESGGWGWWETDEDDEWMTAYVLYGLSQARSEGYTVSNEIIERGREAAAKMVATSYKGGKGTPLWQRTNWEGTRVFLMYALAGASPTPEQLALVRKERMALATETLDAQTLGYLVLLDKRLDIPSHAWEQLERQMKHEGDALAYWKGSQQTYWSDWNDKTATAVGLRALLAVDPKDARVPAVLLWLMTRREDESWGSTRDTAWTLNALCDYLNSPQDVASPSGTIQVSLNQKTLKSVDVAPGKKSEEIVVRVPWTQLHSQGNTLKLQRTTGGQQPLFYTVQVRQTIATDGPIEPLAAKVPVAITREYRRILPPAKGANSWTIQSEPSNNQLKQGDRVRVRLTINVPQEMSYVLIEDPFPSGCEVTERGTADVGNDYDWENWWSNTDVRDDRIAFFARHLTKGKHTIEYNLRAQTPGEYVALPTLLQPMYAPELRAETGETKVSIQ